MMAAEGADLPSSATVVSISDHLVGETRAEAVIGTSPKTA